MLAAENPQAAEQMPQQVFPSATLTQTPLFDQPVEASEDPLLTKAIAIVRQEERASISLLQRKMSIGYMRASRLVERMVEMGIVGESETGSGVRPVLDFGDEEAEEG
jgi:S-DNA-T family DNA segregation ATPase FtsK/SpoIIIE